MQIEIIETASLGDRSYVASDGDIAVVVDPQRDIDRILGHIERLAVRITHVLETHVHNDYVSGGLELSRKTGATYVLPAGSDVAFGHVSVADGDDIEAGSIWLRALHTPGHTHHHTSYALAQPGGHMLAVFTGGSMLYGSTGRTDLVSPEDTNTLTQAQYHSVRRLARELPADAAVLPTHGFGSFCSATPTSGAASTVGEQQRVNPALTLEEQDYVETLLAGLDAYPAYYAHMGPINQAGPPPVDLSPPEPVDPAELRRRLQAGEWVVDLRHRVAFAAGHLPGSLGFELSTNFTTYLGWLYPYETPLTLVGENQQQVSDARRELARIGVDQIVGAAAGPLASLADGTEIRSYRVSDFATLAETLQRQPVHVLDARRNDERAHGYVRGSQHIPLHELSQRIDELPQGPMWVYCGSGYRASIAASILDRQGRDVVMINDDYSAADAAGLEDHPPTEGAGASSA